MEKQTALDLALSQIEKQFGKGSIMRLGETARTPVEVIPTGALPLDVALGVGGIPRGRMTEIYGPEASGKTTLGLHIIAEAQRGGGVAALIDAEHAVDPEYARNLGVSIDDLLVSQPGTGEEALEIVDGLVRSGAVDVVVIDSVAALVPKAEVEGDMGESHVGLQARLMSQALRKLAASAARSKTAIVFVNQIREKIGVMFGNPETTPGGRALKFWASVRIEVRRVDSLKSGTDLVGNRTRAKVVKNKVAPPFRQAEFDIMFGRGISRAGAVLDMAVEAGLIERSGTWFTHGDQRLAQGRENAKTFLEANLELVEDLERKIRAGAGRPTTLAGPVEDAEQLEQAA